MSILNDVKEFVNVPSSDTVFDGQLKIIINSIFNQLGHLCTDLNDEFQISGASTDWSEYSTNPKLIDMVKVVVMMKTKLAFDPPANSVLIQNYKDIIAENEFRLHSLADIETRT